MAWLDDRFWCHPKVNGLSDKAYRCYVDALTYSSGMQTRGFIDPATLKLLRTTTKARDELLAAGLWEPGLQPGSIHIHDWDQHNGKRDERRAKERERKREWRQQHKDAA